MQQDQACVSRSGRAGHDRKKQRKDRISGKTGKKRLLVRPEFLLQQVPKLPLKAFVAAKSYEVICKDEPGVVYLIQQVAFSIAFRRYTKADKKAGVQGYYLTIIQAFGVYYRHVVVRDVNSLNKFIQCYCGFFGKFIPWL